jgi:hypothetical protein
MYSDSKFASKIKKQPNMQMKKTTRIVGKKQTEPNSIYRKCKEAAHMVTVDHPISQPSLGISSIWTPVIAAEATTPVNVDYSENCVLVLVPYIQFVF